MQYIHASTKLLLKRYDYARPQIFFYPNAVAHIKHLIVYQMTFYIRNTFRYISHDVLDRTFLFHTFDYLETLICVFVIVFEYYIISIVIDTFLLRIR